MQCPTDGAVLVMSERSGIEIDYCPTCRGVWLDRGELDKIIERAPVGAASVPQPATRPAYGEQSYEQRGNDQRGYGNAQPRKKKKESWLSELFD